MSRGIKYNGRVGNPASNDHGFWWTDEVKKIGNGPGEVSEAVAKAYFETGCFEEAEWIDAPDDLGHTDVDIDKMTPEEAHAIIDHETA